MPSQLRWHKSGTLTRLTLPGGSHGVAAQDVSYGVDSAGRVTSVKFDGYERTYSLNPLSQVTGYADRRVPITGNPVVTGRATFAYSPDGALEVLDHLIPMETAKAVTYSFTHNGVNQILSATTSNAQYEFRDADALGQSISYAVDGLNRYTSAGAQMLVYDGASNLTGLSDAAGTGWTHTYDTENRLLQSVSYQNGTAVKTVAYAYGPTGRRLALGVNKDHGSDQGTVQVDRFVYMGDEPIADYADDWTLARRYINGPGVDDRVMMVAYGGMGQTVERAFYRTNHQGSVVALVDSANGTVSEIFSYDAYGNSTASANAGQPFRYTGRRFDAETGLYYYRARYYSPDLGRFLQTDPIGYEDQMNLYAYVANDPVNNVDPSGMDTILFINTVKKKPKLTDAELAQAVDIAAVALVTADVLIGGPSGEGIVPATALRQAFKGKVKPGSSGGPGAGKPFSPKTKDAAEQQANGACVFCGRQTSREKGPTQRNTDHADPRSRGGNNSLDNAQNSCRTCNQQKGARTSEEFAEDVNKGERLRALDEEVPE